MESKTITFGNHPFGRNAFIRIIENEGIFNDIEKAINHYHTIFGLTDALKTLESVYFKNGYYKFVFNDYNTEYASEYWEQLVKFVLCLDWEDKTCLVYVGSSQFEYTDGFFSK
jgi:hypothetical protein